MGNIYEQYKKVKELSERTTWGDLGRGESYQDDTPNFVGYSVQNIKTKETKKVQKVDDKGLFLEDGTYLYAGDDFVYAKKYILVDPQGKPVEINKTGIEESEMRPAPGRVAGEQITNDRDIRPGDRVSTTVNDDYGRPSPVVGTVLGVEGDIATVATDQGKEFQVQKIKLNVIESFNPTYDSPETEEGEESFEPDYDNDAFIQSNGFKLTASIGGKYLGTFADDEEAEQALKSYMEKSKFFPNVWFVDDHGGVEQRVLESIDEHELSTEERNDLPDSDFVYPGERKYPIHDIAHARNALARVAANGSPAEKAKVTAIVHKKYPELKEAADEKPEFKPYSYKNKNGVTVLVQNKEQEDYMKEGPDGPIHKAQGAGYYTEQERRHKEYRKTQESVVNQPVAVGELVKVLIDQENNTWSEPGTVVSVTGDDVVVKLPSGEVAVKIGAVEKAA